jgi:carboxymethylenebutenolidase
MGWRRSVGYPGNDDDGRTLQANLDQGKLRTDMLNSARYLKAHSLSGGKLAAVGFVGEAVRQTS